MCDSCWKEYGSPRITSKAVIDAVNSIEDLYKEHALGGRLHIVTDDWNVEDEHLEWCKEQGLNDIEQRCFQLLKPLCIKERASALAIWEKLVE